MSMKGRAPRRLTPGVGGSGTEGDQLKAMNPSGRAAAEGEQATTAEPQKPLAAARGHGAPALAGQDSAAGAGASASGSQAEGTGAPGGAAGAGGSPASGGHS